MKMNKRNSLILGALLLVGGFVAYGIQKRSTAEKPSYREYFATKGDLAITILASGTVQPENRLEIKPPVAGRIDQVLIQEGQTVKKGQILAWMSSTERAALLDAARSEGPEEVKKWEGLYRPTPVIAPISGTIILRSVESGQTFTNTESIMAMSDRLTVKAQVDETDLAQIRLNQTAIITLDAYSTVKVPAQVDQIAFEAKTVNNVTTYTVAVLPTKTPDFMRSGMTANVLFNIEDKKGVLIVPSESIQTESLPGTKGSFVLIPGPKNEDPVKRGVETGMTDGKNTEILSGLVDGEKVLALTTGGAKPPASGSPFSPMGGSRSGGRKR